jgi:hypothetical protein
MPQSRRRKFTWRCATGPVAAIFVSSRRATSSLASAIGHAVEEARIDHAAVAVIGGVGDDEGFRILARRAHHRRVAEPVFVDEVEVALVVRRAAEDGAGAVFHQDEVRDIDRQLPRRIERMHRLDAGVEAHLLGGVDLGLRGAAVPAFGDELGERRIFLRRRCGQRMIRRQRHEFRAEQRVRPRGEDFELAFAVRRGFGSSAKRTSRPSERPIQFFCISRTFSGQRSSVSSASSSSCENFVILKNHCVSSRCSTSAPERQPRPSITCSLASTVCRPGPSSPSTACARPGRRAENRGTFSAGACNRPDRRSRSRGSSRATAPSI